MARRLMYWQVYLHKTTVSSEKVLVNALLRAKYLTKRGKNIFATPCLKYFLYNDINADTFKKDEKAQRNYALLDDNDIWSTIKVWLNDDDKILSILAHDLLNRNLFKVEIYNEPISENHINEIQNTLSEKFGVSKDDAHFLISVGTIQKDMYDVNDDRITILFKDNTLKDISEASEVMNISLLSKKIRKYYRCYQRF